MKKQIYLFFLFFFFEIHLTNAQLKVYPALEPSLVENDPSSSSPIESTFQNNYKVGRNTLFTVKVKEFPNADWQELFVNNTFVNNITTTQPYLLIKSKNSSFVNFEFKGEILLEITSPQIINSVIIRPISKNISKTISGNKLTIKLTKPEKLSVEINGNRYDNLHIFANELDAYTDIESLYPGKKIIKYDSVGYMNYNKANNLISNKLIIVRAGTILKVPYQTNNYSFEIGNGQIILNDNDILYIEGGAYIKGGLIMDSVKNVKILGKGVIDLTNYPKKISDNGLPYSYSSIQGVTIWESENILVDGPVINDSQQTGFQIDDSKSISINDVKIFTRVVWGDVYSSLC